MKVDIAIIGGGPAGLAAALGAKKSGVSNVVILERDGKLGGILNQCIHNGFGLHTFKEELTGPEYASRYAKQVIEQQIPYLLNTIVVDVTTVSGGAANGDTHQTKLLTVMNEERGLFQIEAKAVVLAMGCRERARGALNIPGYRPAGIYSAGTAQRYVNMEGRMPGREVVILGSGDIGLIMARRMTLEGAKVKVVAELMPYSGGLKRNIVQCLDDFGIPLKLSHTVVDIHGKERVEGVTLAQVDDKGKPIKGTEEYIACDTLLLSCGLIPENELSTGMGVQLSPVTSGPVVNESLETNIPGVFACGNVLHVHDLVDYVSEESTKAGEKAAQYVLAKSQTVDICGKSMPEKENECKMAKAARGIPIKGVNGVRYTVPSFVRVDQMEDLLTVRFRVGAVYSNVNVVVKVGDTVVTKQKKRTMAPGEMEQVKLKKAELEKLLQESDATACCGTSDTNAMEIQISIEA
ncbi:MAG: FAD-dependent oxidoreductase [Lachnospiraceae bacterium]|nr:FAD-dependent oxidoreductase [Lachnospiraceae bacterium]